MKKEDNKRRKGKLDNLNDNEKEPLRKCQEREEVMGDEKKEHLKKRGHERIKEKRDNLDNNEKKTVQERGQWKKNRSHDNLADDEKEKHDNLDNN